MVDQEGLDELQAILDSYRGALDNHLFRYYTRESLAEEHDRLDNAEMTLEELALHL